MVEVKKYALVRTDNRNYLADGSFLEKYDSKPNEGSRTSVVVGELETLADEPIAKKLGNVGKLGFAKSNWTHAC